MYPEKPRSNWWYLLPIFLGIIGAIIAYFALRNDDRKKAGYIICSANKSLHNKMLKILKPVSK